ncbi:hypothetical protein F2Q70_00002353 [Brassica cretica]|uniref:Uncharacterized protein n=1 Tax=Brassica cretica TaxID=69181 RepID=A0A8S9J0C5_BRACR|nr:hypothetical protein F2Q70_00002353 [Brassica cretica]
MLMLSSALSPFREGTRSVSETQIFRNAQWFPEKERVNEMEKDSVEDITKARKHDVCVLQYFLLILLLQVYIDFLQDGQLDS